MIVGVLVAYFVIPWVMGLVSRGKTKTAPQQ